MKVKELIGLLNIYHPECDECDVGINLVTIDKEKVKKLKSRIKKRITYDMYLDEIDINDVSIVGVHKRVIITVRDNGVRDDEV